MITRKDTPAYAAVAVIQDAIAGAFAGKIGLANINATAGSSIAHELRAARSYHVTWHSISRRYWISFICPQLGGNKDDAVASSIKDMVDGALRILVDPADAIRQIFDSDDPSAIFGRMMDFFESRPPLTDVVSTLGSFLEGQFGIALTLVTTLKNLADPSLPRTIADACLNYFFNPDGYVTVDEIQHPAADAIPGHTCERK